jgi:hypothetical protein
VNFSDEKPWVRLSRSYEPESALWDISHRRMMKRQTDSRLSFEELSIIS